MMADVSTTQCGNLLWIASQNEATTRMAWVAAAEAYRREPTLANSNALNAARAKWNRAIEDMTSIQTIYKYRKFGEKKQ